MRAVESDLGGLRQALWGKTRSQRKAEGGQHGSCFHSKFSQLSVIGNQYSEIRSFGE